MKSVLYVAATLMIGAGIYGFVDYSKTSRQKEFKTMYDENDLKKTVVREEKKEDKVILSETAGKKEQPVKATEEQEKKPVRKIRKKRSVDLESFSRAPLREKMEVIIPDPKEVKTKEQ